MPDREDTLNLHEQIGRWKAYAMMAADRLQETMAQNDTVSQKLIRAIQRDALGDNSDG